MEDSPSSTFSGLRRVPASIVGFWVLTFLELLSSRLQRKVSFTPSLFVRFLPQVDPMRTEEPQLAGHFLPLRLQFSTGGRAVILQEISVRAEREMLTGAGTHQLDCLQYLVTQPVLVPAAVHREQVVGQIIASRGVLHLRHISRLSLRRTFQSRSTRFIFTAIIIILEVLL